MNKNKRGQAALEFLTTYGWAFLVILVMIGALAYFGILDPTRFLPQRCQFGAEMHCDKFALDSAGIANFELTNALPTHVTITDLEWSVPEIDGWLACETNASVGGSEINTGQTFSRETSTDFVCEDTEGTTALGGVNGTLIGGDKQRVQFKIVYNEGTVADSTYSKDLYGEIYANVR